MSDLKPPSTLLDVLRELILQASRSVNAVQVQTYWQIGRQIVEYEQGGEALPTLGKNAFSWESCSCAPPALRRRPQLSNNVSLLFG